MGLWLLAVMLIVEEESLTVQEGVGDGECLPMVPRVLCPGFLLSGMSGGTERAICIPLAASAHACLPILSEFQGEPSLKVPAGNAIQEISPPQPLSDQVALHLQPMASWVETIVHVASLPLDRSLLMNHLHRDG